MNRRLGWEFRADVYVNTALWKWKRRGGGETLTLQFADFCSWDLFSKCFLSLPIHSVPDVPVCRDASIQVAPKNGGVTLEILTTLCTLSQSPHLPLKPCMLPGTWASEEVVQVEALSLLPGILLGRYPEC